MENLDRMLARWQARGIITAAQASNIRELETTRGRQRRVPLIAESLGYVGAALVLSAAFALAAQFWSQLGVALRIAILLVVTGLLILAGSVTRSSREPAFDRLASFLWLAAVAGAGFLADVVATDLFDIDTGFSLLIGIAMTILAAVLWLERRTAAQLLGVFAGVALLMTGIADVLGGEEAFGILLWGGGVAGLVVTRLDLLSPRRTAYALSSVAVLAGAQSAAAEPFSDTRAWALILGLASALGLQGLSVTWRSLVLLGVGSAGVVLFLFQLVDQYLGDTIGATAALLVAGIALLGVALVAVRLRDKVSSG